MLELAHAANAIRERDQIIFDADHSVGHGQPAERVLDNLLMGFVLFPERRVFAPDAAHHIALFGFLDGCVDSIRILAERSVEALVDAGDERITF